MIVRPGDRRSGEISTRPPQGGIAGTIYFADIPPGMFALPEAARHVRVNPP